jgi:hypothetical protein
MNRDPNSPANSEATLARNIKDLLFAVHFILSGSLYRLAAGIASASSDLPLGTMTATT